MIVNNPAAPMSQRATGRRRNPKGEGARLRDDLVEAAASVLAETGDEAGLSLREVTRRAGVSSPALYLHFQDKDALVSAVLASRFATLERRLADASAAAAGGGPDARLRAGCLAYVALALEDPGTYRVLFGGRAAAEPTGEAAAEQPGSGAFGTLVEGIAGAQAAGAVRAGDPFRLAVPVWAALHGIATLRQARPGFPWPTVEVLVDEVLARMLGLPPA